MRRRSWRLLLSFDRLAAPAAHAGRRARGGGRADLVPDEALAFLARGRAAAAARRAVALRAQRILARRVGAERIAFRRDGDPHAPARRHARRDPQALAAHRGVRADRARLDQILVADLEA